MKDPYRAYWQGYWAGSLIGVVACIVGLYIGNSKPACAQVPNWDNNPYNYKNSEFNYNNSPYKWENSPYNYENSQYNYNSRTRVYTNSGDSIGYETMSPSGVQNYFDNDGNRVGYRGER
jgi:hypothetical protein